MSLCREGFQKPTPPNRETASFTDSNGAEVSISALTPPFRAPILVLESPTSQLPTSMKRQNPETHPNKTTKKTLKLEEYNDV